MDISVVVPFRNEEDHIATSVSALVNQDFPSDRFEIILVDNNSTDRSIDIVRQFPGLRILNEATPGDFAARNRGLAASTGEIIAFTDSDTAPFPDWLHRITLAMSDASVAAVVGRLVFNPESRSLSLLEEYETQKNRFIFSSGIEEIYYGYTCNMAVRRRVFEELGDFPPIQRNSDVVLIRRVVDRWSCRAVTFAAEVRVRRLEVASLRDYLGKQHIYGRDLRRYSCIAGARPLNGAERLKILREVIRRQRYSWGQTALLAALLMAGAACYESGRWRRS